MVKYGYKEDKNFYPRPLRRGRPGQVEFEKMEVLFLSTPSSQRATVNIVDNSGMVLISIHALFAEGDFCVRTHYGGSRDISIHALFAEGDITTSRP